ncbi:MAG TPA: threonine ammonia-lyase [Syntrophobacteraceae bacterium]|nr:threonine ammonia-lyase [Syntrophobacteraceae bacterium]
MISLDDIQTAANKLQDRIIRTPLIHSATFTQMVGAQVFLKLENLQKTGSFKLRGATFKLLRYAAAVGARGVVAASAGNHAQGVALAARMAGVAAAIVMPLGSSISKQEATRGYGGEVILEGKSVEESLQAAQALAREGKVLIHPFDDEDIIVGQGTIGLEILEDLPDPDVIFVPIGGGGLVSGVASAVKAVHPQTRIIGVQAAACPSAYESFRAGRVVRVEARKSIADGLAVKQVGELTFDIIRKNVDDIVIAEEEQIAAAILMLLERKKLLAEGAGAIALAALLQGAVRVPPDGKVVLLISGGNVDSSLLGRVLRQGLFRTGRVMRVSVCLDDVPGALAGLLTHVAKHQANVLQIDHDRSLLELPIYVSRVELELETRGPDHMREILAGLKAAGYSAETSNYLAEPPVCRNSRYHLDRSG